MDNTVKLLMIGFYASLFAASILMIIIMYTKLERLYEVVDNHNTARSVLEECLIE